MIHTPGKLLHAKVTQKDGSQQDAIVYLSIRVPGENERRPNHCWRYGPPSHKIVEGLVTPGEPVEREKQ